MSREVKTFDEIMDSILDEYALDYLAAKSGRGVHEHFLKQKKEKLKSQLMSWFVVHVERIADNKEELKDELFG